MGNSNQKNQQTIARVLDERNQKLKQKLKIIEGLLFQNQIDKHLISQIVKSTANQLVALLNKGSINSKQIVTIYSYRAMTLGRQLNLITQENFEMAYSMAEECDRIRKQSGKRNWTIGDDWDLIKYFPPFYGIPISVKDIFNMKGKRTTIGVIARSHIIQEEDCGIITCLKESGMIPFVRSNVSQLTMTFQSNNHLWGRSINIWNQNRSVGGSSGGQAGLLASNSSAIGIGTDIGGSLRIPAAFCGIYSLKPCVERLSTSNSHSSSMSNLLDGKTTIKSVFGPMGKCVDDLFLWMKIANTEQFYKDKKDPYHRYKPFEQNDYLAYQKIKKLKIGYYKSFDIFESTPASRRVVEDVKQFLVKEGHQLVEINIPHLNEMVQSYFNELAAEGKAKGYVEILQGESFVPEYQKVVNITLLNPCLRWLLKKLLKRIFPRIGLLADKSDELTVQEYLKHKGQVECYRKQFYKYWKANNLDFIIGPGFGCQAILHGQFQWLAPCAIYTFIWNYLNYAVGALPISVVREQQQEYQSKHKDPITRTMIKNVASSIGLPVGVQIIGLPFEQQKVLGIMKAIDDHFNFKDKHTPKMNYY